MQNSHHFYDIGYICESIKNENIVINRKFSRKLIWNDDQKYYLIDSIFKGYHVPEILTREMDDQTIFVIDGKQSLTTIFDFIIKDEEFKELLGNLTTMSCTELKQGNETERAKQRGVCTLGKILKIKFSKEWWTQDSPGLGKNQKK